MSFYLPLSGGFSVISTAGSSGAIVVGGVGTISSCKVSGGVSVTVSSLVNVFFAVVPRLLRVFLGAGGFSTGGSSASAGWDDIVP